MFRSLIAIVMLLCSTLTLASERATEAWRQIDRAEAVIIDVRSPGEYAQARLKGAINIPYDVIGQEIGQLGLAKDQPIVVYCRSGRRSGIAQEVLQSQGFNRVFNGGGLQEMLESER
ncbi:rhodanese-like domain-containing protein [Ferrimonas sediminicola]|uniref:Rhodanese-like domain-containing protein n=1 Tax=Ferrimonas sediminicola TaxID=2569538 RepID=A0A4U1BH67_9GAMM|nr:rhodanese-like domain-containing protein [Ferrimonas sediminicola]TKB49815.1 rhodanese-like domain-containing protein [Ferrimonas sediminicola]